MITLASLVRLAREHAEDLDRPVVPFSLGQRVFRDGERPAVMGTVNLSRDSTYRESVATSVGSAIRKARVMAAQGADLVDVGAESTTAKAARVDAERQLATLVPVVRALAADGIVVSAETYEPVVAEAALDAGAQVINFTGAEHEEEIFRLAAARDALVVLCCVRGSNVREITDVALDVDPIPGLLAYFERRVATARACGVERLVIDPGMGFFYGNLTDPRTRVDHQAQVILNSFRLRRLGLPICHALPHAFDLFEDEFRTAEGFFAVLAHLGGTGLMRTHEVPRVLAVLDALHSLGPTAPERGPGSA